MKLDEIVDLINRGMTFYRTFIDTDEKHRGSYTEEKTGARADWCRWQ